ncbi:hypothetical protein N0V88_007504 [Collariella sp. IMI 366227]|nr:hypothetical protein N0V88_007504 [Collariella sp. IMI 366227]
MAEPFGLVAGALNIAGLFNNCVDCFEYVQLARRFGCDFERCQLRLDIAKTRLVRWGEAVKINDDPRFQSSAPTDKSVQLAQSIIGGIALLFESARNTSKRYELVANQQDMVMFEDKNIKPTEGHEPLEEDGLSTIRWGGSLEKIIDEIASFVDDLERVFPVEAACHTLAGMEIEEVEDEASLVMLKDATGGIDTALSDAVSQKIDTSAGRNSANDIRIEDRARVHLGNVFTEVAVYRSNLLKDQTINVVETPGVHDANRSNHKAAAIMSFAITLRAGPARLAAKAPQLAATSLRTFHQSAPKNSFFTSRTASLAFRSNSKSSSNIISRLQGASRRGYRTHYESAYDPAARRKELVRKLVVGGAIFGGTLVGVNAVFNRETREGSIPAFERAYLNQTFMHTGLGVGIIGLTAYQMVQSGFVYRLMVTNPWIVGIGGLALSIGSMIATRAIDPDNYIPKYLCWTAFNATQAAFVAPLMMMAPPALLARAGLYTLAMMGSISFVGATAKQDKYMYLGGPLLAGAAIVAVSGFAPLVLPATAVRTLALSEKLWLYGGLAVFGGFTLYDVQKVLYHARAAQAGVIKADPVNESISLELDFLNIFVRMVQILMMQQRRK